MTASASLCKAARAFNLIALLGTLNASAVMEKPRLGYLCIANSHMKPYINKTFVEFARDATKKVKQKCHKF